VKEIVVLPSTRKETRKAVAQFRRNMHQHLEDRITGERHGKPDAELFHIHRKIETKIGIR